MIETPGELIMYRHGLKWYESSSSSYRWYSSSRWPLVFVAFLSTGGVSHYGPRVTCSIRFLMYFFFSRNFLVFFFRRLWFLRPRAQHQSTKSNDATCIHLPTHVFHQCLVLVPSTARKLTPLLEPLTSKLNTLDYWR